jgi:hypothetical protein
MGKYGRSRPTAPSTPTYCTPRFPRQENGFDGSCSLLDLWGPPPWTQRAQPSLILPALCLKPKVLTAQIHTKNRMLLNRSRVAQVQLVRDSPRKL